MLSACVACSAAKLDSQLGAAVDHTHLLTHSLQVGGVPLQRALSASQLNYLSRSIEALAGRYFLLVEHGVPVPRHADGGIVLSYTDKRHLLSILRQHDSQRRLPADDGAALAYIERWLAAWPETESGRWWAQARPKTDSEA